MEKIKKTLVKGKILENKCIYENVYKQKIFVGEIAKDILPMQFCSIYVGKGEMILPRPISIFDVDKENNTIEIIFHVFGKGTSCLSSLNINEKVDILLPLGNGITSTENMNNVALVGGGIGIPPLHYLAKFIKEKNPNINIDIYLGYKYEPFLNEYFKDFNLYVASDNSNNVFKGNVIELMKKQDNTYDTIISCGPTPMLKSLSVYANEINTNCLISLEERMACSIGACVGCVVKIKTDDGIKNKKVCVDGPVFNSKVVVFGE